MCIVLKDDITVDDSLLFSKNNLFTNILKTSKKILNEIPTEYLQKVH